MALGPWSEDTQPRPHADPVTQGRARLGWVSLLLVFTVGLGADREGRRLLHQRVSVLTVSAFLARVPSHFRRVRLPVTLWTVARQAPLSLGLSRREYWRGLPCASPGIFPTQGLNPASPTSPALAGGFFTTGHLEALGLHFSDQPSHWL